MPKIASSVIEEIKQLNIVDVISPHVELTRAGRFNKGLCPFHSEKTPSFSVNENMGIFKCFGCNEAGDAITFIMKHMNLPYPEAVVYLCESFGIEVRYEEGGAPDRSVKDLKDLHEAVLEYARKQLFSDKGKNALEYLYSRGFDKNAADRFLLGFIPKGTSAAPFEKHFSKELLTKASGLFFDGNYGMRCFFDNRLLFPIHNSAGKCVGFSGRAMDPNDKAKYKNSPETAVFSKRKELYNLYRAKENMQDKSCYIVEGYFDVMRMDEAGYPNTVAIMGTAFTREQVTQLKRYVEEYNLILDGDEAGIKAMRDSRNVALDANIYPNVIFLPKGDDPDTFLKEKGKDAFDALISGKEDLLMYMIRSEKENAPDANRRFHRLQQISKMLEQIKDPYRREYYIKTTADIFEVSGDTLKSGIGSPNPRSVVIKKVSKRTNLIYRCERDLLACLTRLDDEMLDSVVTGLSTEHFQDEEARKIYNKVLDICGQNDNINVLLHEPEIGEMLTTFALDLESDADLYATAINNKNQMILNHYQNLHNTYPEKISHTQDIDEQIRLLDEQRGILQQIKELETRIVK